MTALNDISVISRDILDSLNAFERDRRIDLDILSHETLYVCSQCSHILARNRFRGSICLCAKEVMRVADVEQHSISSFSQGLQRFIEKNYWFEHAIDYLLRRRQFQTKCGYHVLGHSGTTHEIDVIAESVRERLRFFCECKTGEIGANDVFVLAGKMSDIGCSRGYIFTLSESVSREISLLARSRNISIVTNVLERPFEELLQAITEAQ